MDDRVVEFIRGLRAAGVRVSIAESGDALAALETLESTQRGWFRSALRSSLVKDHADQPIFEQLFPIYFSAAPPPPAPLRELLSEEDSQRFEEALRRLGLEFERLLARLLNGEGLSEEEIAQALAASGMGEAREWRQLGTITRRARHHLGLAELSAELESLLQILESLGMDARTLRRIRQELLANLESLEQALRQAAGAALARQLTKRTGPDTSAGDLADRPFQSLSPFELDLLRREAARLAARLRTRLALRRRRGEGRQLDAKATLRANLAQAGVPFELIHRRRLRKAKFTLLCDVSTSMRPVVSFLLYLLFQIQDQVARTRCFAYIDHLTEVSDEFAEHRPTDAVARVLRRLPPGHYNTDLGRSLEQLVREHPDAIDGRTTLVVCGDGRNNFRPPRQDLLEQIARRVRHVIWFNPEPPHLWGSEDSDMLCYAPLVDSVRQVSNLRQLAEAIDRLLV